MKAASYLIKAPPAMLDRWHKVAGEHGLTLAQLIRQAVNKEIERLENTRR